MLPGKLGFSTLRELERRSSRVFAIGVCGYLAGAALALEGQSDIGFPLLAFSATTLLIDMGWITWTLHQPSSEVRCPYCSRCNEVFVSRPQFRCGHCGKESSSVEHEQPATKENPAGTP